MKVKDINDNPPTCPSAVTVFEVQENENIGKKWLLLKAMDKAYGLSSICYLFNPLLVSAR